jgi:hypothetical protein
MDSVGLTIEGVRGDVDGDEYLRLLRLRLAASPVGLDDWLHPLADDVPVEPAPTDLIDEAVGAALRSIQRLVIDQHAQLDADGLERLAVGLNQVRCAAEAANVAVAERVLATNPFRGDGFFTGKTWLAHRLQLSKAGSVPSLPDGAHATTVGVVGRRRSSMGWWVSPRRR